MIKSILKELPLTLLLCLGYTRLVVLTLAPVHAQENCMDSNFTPVVKTTVTPSQRRVLVKIEVTDVDLVIPRRMNASKMRLVGAYLSGTVEQSMPPYVKLTDEVGDWAGDIHEARLPDYTLFDYVRVYDLAGGGIGKNVP